MTDNKIITLAVDRSVHQRIYEAHQGERLARTFTMQFSSDGNILALANSDTVKADVMIADKLIDTIDGKVNASANTATVTLSQRAMCVSGMLTIKVTLTNGNAILTAESILLRVTPTADKTYLTPPESDIVKKIITELNKFANLKQLEVLGAFPNLSNCCINNCVNFSSVSGFSLTYGTLDTADGKLIITNTDYASTQLTAKLKKSVVLNEDTNMLVKLRVKAVTGSQVVIYPKIGLTDGTSIFVTTDSILGSNLSTNTAYPKYNLPDNKWVDIWYVFGADTSTNIDSIDVHIAPYATLKIASLQAFYSLDKTGSGGAIITDSNITSTSINYYTATTTNSNITITPTTYEEGEI